MDDDASGAEPPGAGGQSMSSSVKRSENFPFAAAFPSSARGGVDALRQAAMLNSSHAHRVAPRYVCDRADVVSRAGYNSGGDDGKSEAGRRIRRIILTAAHPVYTSE
jgi:hypothetical protein